MSIWGVHREMNKCFFLLQLLSCLCKQHICASISFSLFLPPPRLCSPAHLENIFVHLGCPSYNFLSVLSVHLETFFSVSVFPVCYFNKIHFSSLCSALAEAYTLIRALLNGYCFVSTTGIHVGLKNSILCPNCV